MKIKEMKEIRDRIESKMSGMFYRDEENKDIYFVAITKTIEEGKKVGLYRLLKLNSKGNRINELKFKRHLKGKTEILIEHRIEPFPSLKREYAELEVFEKEVENFFESLENKGE